VNAVDSLQEALAGEHAAIYAYGVLGGRIPAATQPAAATAIAAAYATHRARRDQLESFISAAGKTPVAPDVAYDLEGPVDSPSQVLAVALRLETRCQVLYAQVVGEAGSAERRWASAALTDSAVRALGFGGTPEAFPGAPEL
jgi:Domain of unknown function (DUF4439)